MSEYIPGDWHIQKWGDGKVSVDCSSNTIATLNDNGKETMPFARLIAAAPDLLAALKEFLFSFDAIQAKDGYAVALKRFCVAKRNARDAIAEAERRHEPH